MVKTKTANLEKRNEKTRPAELTLVQSRELESALKTTMELLEALKTENEVRKKSEESLRAVNDLFRLFMHNSPIYSFIKEVSATESRVVQASENYAQMIGIPGSEMIGKTMAELFPEEFAAKITTDDWAVVSSGLVLKLEEEFNGRIYQTIKFPIVPGEKSFLGGYTIDITERKRIEDELRQAKVEAETATETISRLARTDDLTGLHNRRSFNEIFGLALSAARRYRHPLSMISIDLDHFKTVNDTLGHSVGDLVLKEFATLMLGMVRADDIAVRWGGEEFIILLPHTTGLAASALAERIRVAFEQNRSSITPFSVTASFGVAQLQEGEPGESLIRRSDDALYRAKHQGRNCVVIADLG